MVLFDRTTFVTASIAADADHTAFASAFDLVCTVALRPCVGVTRSLVNQAGGYTYTVEFSAPKLGGNMALVTKGAGTALTGTLADVVVANKQQGNELQGTFRLSLDGTLTARVCLGVP